MGTPVSREALRLWLEKVDYEKASTKTKLSLNYYFRLLPAWPMWANEQQIRRFYAEAKWLHRVTGKKFHVDHIIPLCNDYVCGLHNEFNLQVLTETENLQKSNNYWPDMWMEQSEFPLECRRVHQYALPL